MHISSSMQEEYMGDDEKPRVADDEVLAIRLVLRPATLAVLHQAKNPLTSKGVENQLKSRGLHQVFYQDVLATLTLLQAEGLCLEHFHRASDRTYELTALGRKVVGHICDFASALRD